MFRETIHTMRLCLLVVSAISAGCFSVEQQPLSKPFRLLSIDLPLLAAKTSGAPAELMPLFAEQTELHLEALRQAVLRRNPTLTVMQSAWRAALERYPQVASLDDPSFSYGLAPATIGASALDFGQRFEVSQRFPWPGTLRLKGEAAQREAQAAGEDVNAARLQLLEATDQAFYDLYFVQRAIDINLVNQELLSEFQRITERRYAAGLVQKQDALQAEVEHQYLAHQGIILSHTRGVAVARLNTLLHLPPESFLPPPPKDLPGVQSLPPMAVLQSAAMQHRPELRALALRIEARSADVKLTQLAYFPNFTISGGYNSLWQEDDLRPDIGVSLNFPLQLGRRKAALQEAQAKAHEAQARLEEQRAQVTFAVSQAAENVRENAHVVELYRTAIIPTVEENLAAARSDYETGLSDFVTLITAEKALRLAELNYHQALANYHKGRAQLEQAVGLPLENVKVTP